MTTNLRSADTDAVNQQNNPDQQYDALSDDFCMNISYEAAGIADDDARVSRDKYVSAREDATHAPEDELRTIVGRARKAKDQMEHLSHYASLPGLPSRILPKERLIRAIAWEKRRGTKLALLFLDLDRFKTINDSLRHPLGDELIESIVQQDLQIGVAIGISMHPDDGDDAETLVQSADVAMYHAKNRAGNSYYFFTPGMSARATE